MKKLKKKYLLISLITLIIPMIFAPIISFLWDDCEDLDNNEWVKTWTPSANCDIGTTTTNKYGTYAIYIKQGVGGYEAANLVLHPNFVDWSGYTSITLWVAPINDDGTPAINKNCGVIIGTTSSYGANAYVFSFALGAIADIWTQYTLEVNGSGVGISPSEVGSPDWTNVRSFAVRISSGTDNIDMAFDSISHTITTTLPKEETNWGIWTQFTLIGTIIYSGIFIMLVSVFYIMIVGK